MRPRQLKDFVRLPNAAWSESPCQLLGVSQRVRSTLLYDTRLGAPSSMSFVKSYLQFLLWTFGCNIVAQFKSVWRPQAISDIRGNLQ